MRKYYDEFKKIEALIELIEDIMLGQIAEDRQKSVKKESYLNHERMKRRVGLKCPDLSLRYPLLNLRSSTFSPSVSAGIKKYNSKPSSALGCFDKRNPKLKTRPQFPEPRYRPVIYQIAR